MRHGIDVVCATPGRLNDHLIKRQSFVRCSTVHCSIPLAFLQPPSSLPDFSSLIHTSRALANNSKCQDLACPKVVGHFRILVRHFIKQF